MNKEVKRARAELVGYAGLAVQEDDLLRLAYSALQCGDKAVLALFGLVDAAGTENAPMKKQFMDECAKFQKEHEAEWSKFLAENDGKWPEYIRASSSLVEKVGDLRRDANESRAIGSLRGLCTAQALYREGDPDKKGKIAYAASLSKLAGVGPFVDAELATGTRSGYKFEILAANDFAWSATATPVQPGKTGTRSFFIDESGIVRSESGEQATAKSPDIDQGSRRPLPPADAERPKPSRAGMVWKATPADLKGAARVGLLQAAQEDFKKKNGIYARSLAILADHGLVRKEIASGVYEGMKYRMECDEKSFAAVAEPTTSEMGARMFTAKNGKKVMSSVAGDETGQTTVKVKTASGEIKANGDWQSIGIAANEGDEVHVYAEGEWKIGPSWKPHGWCGSDEKSSFADYRVVTGDNVKVGCLLMRVEGGKLIFFAKEASNAITIKAEKPGTIQFRINDKDVQNNAGTLTVFILVLPPVDQSEDEGDVAATPQQRALDAKKGMENAKAACAKVANPGLPHYTWAKNSETKALAAYDKSDWANAEKSFIDAKNFYLEAASKK